MEKKMDKARTEGCFTIVENLSGEILLVKRKDYPIWDLPGGIVDEWELLQDCAVREVAEETGYIIAIEKKIGEYFHEEKNDMQHLFYGSLTGGSPMKDGPETAGVDWFNPNRLPLLMVPNRRRQIRKFCRDRARFVTGTLKTPLWVKWLVK